jgi:ribonuclease P protein component
MIAADRRLRKHADYQDVYKAGRKQFGKQMSYFFKLRQACAAGPDGTAMRMARPDGPRIGLTVGKALGKAVDRNRIKRRMREAVRRQLFLLRGPVDVVLHPRRSVMDLDFATLEREIAGPFRAIQRALEAQLPSAQSAQLPSEKSAQLFSVESAQAGTPVPPGVERSAT